MHAAEKHELGRREPISRGGESAQRRAAAERWPAQTSTRQGQSPNRTRPATAAPSAERSPPRPRPRCTIHAQITGPAAATFIAKRWTASKAIAMALPMRSVYAGTRDEATPLPPNSPSRRRPRICLLAFANPLEFAVGRLAQLVRAPPLHGGCRGFESLIAHKTDVPQKAIRIAFERFASVAFVGTRWTRQLLMCATGQLNPS